MPWAFKLDSYVKQVLYEAMPELAADPQLLQQYAGEIGRPSEAQLTARRNALGNG